MQHSTRGTPSARSTKLDRPPLTPQVPLQPARRKTTRALGDDARLLPRHRSDQPALEQRRLERAQAAAVLDAVATDTTDAPLRYELTKPGDKQALRGVPLVGAGAGAIWGTSPHGAGLARLSRADEIRERTTL